MPETLAQVNQIKSLNPQEQVWLNQIRGNSYLHIFGLVEEFIVPAVINHVQKNGLEDLEATQALLHFAEEESKHIRLFRKFAEEFEQGFGNTCGLIGPVREIAKKILEHSELGVMLIILYIEWMTQYHYLESVRNNHLEDLDPLFCSLLKNHWLEEAQHTILDTLMVQELVKNGDQSTIHQGMEDFFNILDLLNNGLKMQMELDLDSLSRKINRPLTAIEKQEIQAMQEKSYQWTFIGSGITHRKFMTTVKEISLTGYIKLVQMSSQYS